MFLTENKELETVSVNTAPAKSSLQNFLSPALCPGCHSAASLSAAAAGMPSQLSGLTKTQEGRETFSEKGIQIQSWFTKLLSASGAGGSPVDFWAPLDPSFPQALKTGEQQLDVTGYVSLPRLPRLYLILVTFMASGRGQAAKAQQGADQKAALSMKLWANNPDPALPLLKQSQKIASFKRNFYLKASW